MGEDYKKGHCCQEQFISFFVWMSREGYGSATSLFFCIGIHPPSFKEDDLRQESLTLMSGHSVGLVFCFLRVCEFRIPKLIDKAVYRRFGSRHRFV